MPAPVETLVRPQSGTVTVSIEPVHNALHSLMLIVKAEHLSGLGDWVINTREAMSAAELDNHRLVVEGFHYALYPQRSLPSFPAYIEHLAEQDPFVLRDRMLDAYYDLPCVRDEPVQYASYKELLQSPDNYVNFLLDRFGPKSVDLDLEKQAYAYAVNPTAMQLLIVSHLRMMWDRFFATEWERVEPMLLDSVNAFEAINFSRFSDRATAEFVIGQPFSDSEWAMTEEEFQRIVLVPSAHIGPYLGKYFQNDTFVMLFGARLPEGTTVSAPDLSRNEIVVRLNALADDTRLRILHYIADQGEQRSQDIMNELDLSQSATSRHLKQLSATGYLVERRCEGAKCYSLGDDRLRDTFQAVLAFLAVTP